MDKVTENDEYTRGFNACKKKVMAALVSIAREKEIHNSNDKIDYGVRSGLSIAARIIHEAMEDTEDGC